MIPSAQVIEHAEVAAVYFRALTEKGVSVTAAIQLTGSYISSLQISETMNRKPREPWDDAP